MLLEERLIDMLISISMVNNIVAVGTITLLSLIPIIGNIGYFRRVA